jgi:glycosyltransferase involved in cell wall biosynthesis
VLSSFAEGLPIVLMEALALGRPVIATSVAGIPELVEHRVNGWLVPAGSPDALAAALREAIEASDERIAQMGADGAKRVRALHDLREQGARLEHLMLGARSA